MPKVMGYLYDGVFKTGCSGVSRKALPVVLVICKSLCIHRHSDFYSQEALSVPSKAESGISSLFCWRLS